MSGYYTETLFQGLSRLWDLHGVLHIMSRVLSRTKKKTTLRQRCCRQWKTWKSKFPAEIKQMPNVYINRWVTHNTAVPQTKTANADIYRQHTLDLLYHCYVNKQN